MAKGKQMLYTQQGYQELVDELHYLKHEKREKIKILLDLNEQMLSMMKSMYPEKVHFA